MLTRPISEFEIEFVQSNKTFFLFRMIIVEFLKKKICLLFQLSLREKMLSEIPIQRRKVAMSIEKLQVHFGRGKSTTNGESK